MELKSIGIIHSPYKDRKECPLQGREEICWIEVFEQYAEGLRDIDGFSDLILFYWLHCSKGYSFLVKTPRDSAPHGVFATGNRKNRLGPWRSQKLRRSVSPIVRERDEISDFTWNLRTDYFMDVSEVSWRFKGGENDRRNYPRLGEYGD